MERRTFLTWVSRFLGSAVAAIVAVPGIRHVWTTLQPNGKEVAGASCRLVRWKDLRVGEPAQFPIMGERYDAWHVQPREVIGRVWLVRRQDSESPEAGGVTAFTSLCPHMGCQVQKQSRGSGFVCPCHRATFKLDGQPDEQGSEKNHAPRGLDELPCEVVKDDAGEWWVEVQYQRFEPGRTQKVVRA
jgi:menaquinol-cytochrome c reductase iron-sulfur subunit